MTTNNVFASRAQLHLEILLSTYSFFFALRWTSKLSITCVHSNINICLLSADGSLTFYNQGETYSNGQLYGYNVSQRFGYLPTGASYTSWIAPEIVLPQCTLLRFYIYAWQTLHARSRRLRLQIWRPVGTPQSWQLVWQQAVVVGTGRGLNTVSYSWLALTCLRINTWTI